MRKYLSIIAGALVCTAAQAQDINDALRYAQEDLNGTARFRAMGGAFGALGGDLSSLNVNPAGSAVFANSQVALSLTSYNTRSKSDYFGTRTSEMDYAFDLNQAGGVYVLTNDDKESDWKKLTLALNYDNIRNLDNTVFTAGTNPSNSIANYFLNFANGVPLNILQDSFYEQLGFGDAQAFLGYQGYIINPTTEDPTNTTYVSNVPAGAFYQQNTFASTGFNGKLNFNVAAQYQNWLYIGLNLNSHFTDYRQSTSFYEENTNNTEAGIQRMRFNNELYTYGSGFSFQLGGIAKVNESFRVGLAYESPTWYRLNDEFSQSLSSVRVDDATDETLTTIVDPQITLVYETHKLQTPGKWTGSMAYVFGKSGLISVDYSIKDYSNTKFRPESDFIGTNDQMSDILDMAGELRVGAEKKIKQWSLRAGYRYEQSPYKDSDAIGDLNAISGGLGYNFGETKVDLSYTYAKRETEQGFFSQGLTDPARINSVSNNVTLTVLFEL